MGNNESAEKPNKSKKMFAIGAAFIAIVSAVGGAFIDRFAQTVVDQVFPPKDQVSEIVLSIEDLNQNISKNSDAVTSVVAQLAQRNSDPDTQKLIEDLTTQVNSLVLQSKQIGQRAENLGVITQGIVSGNFSTKGASLWFPVGKSASIVDEKNTFGIRELNDTSGIKAVLNGNLSFLYVGDRLEFDSTSQGKCVLTYFGREGDAHGFGLSCSK